ncbi:MAG: sodium:proton antiporter [Phycisphaerales bacterium]|nr:sodium:proton antiporter [Phycisphaerales bacterium]
MLASLAEHGIVSSTLTVFISLLAFAAVIGVLSKFVKVPYTIALVLAGLLVAVLGAAPDGAVITQELVLALFLPPLLFQAGLHLDIDTLQRKAVPVAILAIPGVAVTTVLVALVARPFFGVESAWMPALLFGALLAPTDPISVLATLRVAGAPKRLRTLIEGESLFNDGTGVVLFLILMTAVFGGAHVADISIASGVLQFIQVAGLGVVFGLGFGLIAFWLLRRLNDHVLENAITIVLAWGSFIVAERSGASGVIAVVVAGLIIGNYGTRLAMGKRTIQTINTFWESIDFIVNSIVFLLIGFELQYVGGISALMAPKVLIGTAACFGAILAARAIMVYPTAWSVGGHWPSGWKHVIFWSGMKGSIPLALVLGLPGGEIRDTMLPITFGVVLVSLLLQGFTIGPLIRLTGVKGDEDEIADAGH